MHEPTYRQALSQAWHLVWRNKILWIFGLFSIFLGQFGVGDFVGRVWMLTERKVASVSWLLTISGDTTLTQKLGLVWVGGILVGVGLLIIVVAVLSQGSLILSAIDLFKGKHEPKLKKIWHQSNNFFWRLLALNIVRKIFLGLLATMVAYISVSLIYAQNLGSYYGLLLIMFVGLFLAMIISAVLIYASCYAVADNQKFFTSLKKAWHLFSDHLLVSVELSVILTLASFLLLAVVLAGSTLVFLPSLIIWLLAGIFSLPILAFIALFLGLFLLLAWVIVAGAIFNAFTICAWTYLFMKMRHEGVASRTLHYLKKFFGR